MEYTTNYQLPVWAETDRILRTDFNEAYQKLDAALKTNADTTAANTSAIASKGNCMVISGSYTGTGGVGSAAPNSLSFDKKPLAILILPANGSGGYPQNMTLLREYLGISAGEKVYLACDTTLLGTCKYGYAFAESGVYSRRYGGMEFISWEIFADSGFRPFDIGEFGIGIGPLTLCHTKTGEPGNALRFIEELQKYLRQNRKQG